MKTRLITPMLGVLALASVTSVASVAAAQIPTQLPPAVITDTVVNTVTVQNNRKAPVAVYLETGTFDRRLGLLKPLETKTLPLPRWAVQGRQTVRLFAHADDQVADLTTAEFTLAPPGRIGMVIPTREEMQPVARTDTMMAVILPEEMANATLTVENPRDVPVTVLAAQERFDVRLGQVPANSRVTLRFPRSVVSPFGSIQIVVRPQGDHDLASQLLVVRQGDHIGMRVPPR